MLRKWAMGFKKEGEKQRYYGYTQNAGIDAGI